MTKSDIDIKLEEIEAKQKTSFDAIQEVNELIQSGKKSFYRRDFEYGRYSNLKWQGVELSRCNFDFSAMTFSDFSGSDLSKSKMFKTDLRNSVFKGADLSETFGANNNLSYSDFTDASLAYAGMSLSHLGYSVFRNAKLTGANLELSTLYHCDFSDADFSGAKMTMCELHFSNFDNADFSAADLTGAGMYGASFVGTQFSRRTNLEYIYGAEIDYDPNATDDTGDRSHCIMVYQNSETDDDPMFYVDSFSGKYPDIIKDIETALGANHRYIQVITRLYENKSQEVDND